MKLQGLFRELFQLDMADLDFGLYRLFNIKHRDIEDFLTEQLPKEVDEKFQIVTERDRAGHLEWLEKLKGQIEDNFPPDTLLPNGDVKPAYMDAPLARRYLDQKMRVERIQASEEQKADVFNHLFNFFSRYYDEGDFIPKRFYGSRGNYAVPYNGEEVFFHWANKDQHYVKTGENFRDYTFKTEGLGTEYRIRFVLSDATTPRDNTKGQYRYFFPQPQQMTLDKETDTLILPFEYRLPTEEEVQRHGTNIKGQDAILMEAAPKIMEAIPDDMLRDLLGEIVHRTDNGDVSLLLKRLRHFTRKNTTDFFIHKDLEGFLKQELEFYIKDQMLHLADLETDFDQKGRMLRVFRHLADTIITFLSQIEEVQKRLFEKKKFVLETNYCMTLDRIPEALYPEIAANDAQREEWVRLFAINEIQADILGNPDYARPLTVAFLKANDELILDTRFFDEGFKARVLVSIEDVDEECDGLLIHSENFQALDLVMGRYRNSVDVIYIDPPYNTGDGDFVYKDEYRHSSWLSMMCDRCALSHYLLSTRGVFVCSLDDNEYAHLRMLLQSTFPLDTFVGNAVWRKTSGSNESEFSHVFDNTLIFKSLQESRLGLIPRSDKQRKLYSNPDNDPRGPWASTDYTCKWSPEQRPNLAYDLDNPFTGKKVYPKEKAWRFSQEEHRKNVEQNKVWWGLEGELKVPRYKRLLCETQDGVVTKSLWDDVGTNQHGKAELVARGFSENDFSNPKPVGLISRAIHLGSEASMIMDYFAGSGTTAHAVINLNREDGGNRKYILVEMADYFDIVLIPRIKKVIYSKDWKNGKPVSREGISHMFKYIRLESYEDALHNLASDGTLARIKSREEAYKKAKGENEHCIRYLVKLPMEASDTMLNLAKLEHPFNYTLEILTDDGPREQTVDLVETFNLLYGLSVRRLETWTDENDERCYRIVKATDRDGLKRILVVWRDMSDLDPKKEREFLEGMLKKEDEFDEKLINGDTATPGFRSLDRLFKRLMEAA